MSGCGDNCACKTNQAEPEELAATGEFGTPEQEAYLRENVNGLVHNPSLYFMDDAEKWQRMEQISNVISELQDLTEWAYQHIMWLTGDFANHNDFGSIYAPLIDPAEALEKELTMILGTMFQRMGSVVYEEVANEADEPADTSKVPEEMEIG